MHEAIIQAESQLLLAMRTGNVASLEALLHNELLFHIPGGNVVTKAMDIEAHRSRIMIVESIVQEEPLIHINGDTAVVSVATELKGSFSGQPIDGKFSYLRVWKYGNGNWQVIAGSCIPVVS